MMITRVAKILSSSCGASVTSIFHSRMTSSSAILFKRSFSSRLHSSAPLHFTQRLFSSPSCGFDMKLDYEESVKQIDEVHNGLKVIKTAAVRGLEFNNPQHGNYLTMNLLNNFQKKLELLQGNWTANAIFLGSQSIDLFSVGVHDDDVQAEGLPLFQKIQDIAEMIEGYPEKNLFALYDGYITGTPFGMLLSSTVASPYLSHPHLPPSPPHQYRLGTSKTILSIDEPTKGQIPLGGLAFKFCQSSPQYGKAVSHPFSHCLLTCPRLCSSHTQVIRYLCCSGAFIDSTTLYELGILTNVTGHKPYLGLQYSDTIPVK
jgi:hypothetical protein